MPVNGAASLDRPPAPGLTRLRAGVAAFRATSTEQARHMPDMTLSEAAKWAGVTRPTIHKALTSGRLSGRRDDNGQWRIDPAELERVYSPAARGGPVDVSGNGQLSSLDIASVMAAKDREIELLREMAAKAEAREADLRVERDRLLGIVEAAQRQLTHERPTGGVVGWLARLRRRS